MGAQAAVKSTQPQITLIDAAQTVPHLRVSAFIYLRLRACKLRDLWKPAKKICRHARFRRKTFAFSETFA